MTCRTAECKSNVCVCVCVAVCVQKMGQGSVSVPQQDRVVVVVGGAVQFRLCLIRMSPVSSVAVPG